MIDSILNFGNTVLDKLFVDKTTVIAGKNKLQELARTGELLKIAGQYDISLAEASSKDKWTSRARPAIIYVTLAFILFSIPFSILNMISPALGSEMVKGIQLWLTAIPKILYECMGLIIGIYEVCRSYEKKHGVAK